MVVGDELGEGVYLKNDVTPLRARGGLCKVLKAQFSGKCSMLSSWRHKFSGKDGLEKCSALGS